MVRTACDAAAVDLAETPVHVAVTGTLCDAAGVVAATSDAWHAAMQQYQIRAVVAVAVIAVHVAVVADV